MYHFLDLTELTAHAIIGLMATIHEKFTVLKDAPGDSDITKIHNLLMVNEGFFIDRELMVLLSRPEVSQILEIPMQRRDIGDSTLGDLIRREEIREWTNLPEMLRSAKVEGDGISLLSVVEYVLKKDKGIVNGPGEFPSDGNQVALQKDVLRRILSQVPDWKTRVNAYLLTSN